MLDLKMNFKKKYEHNLNCPFCSVKSEHFLITFLNAQLAFMHQNQFSIKLEMLGTISDIHLLSSVGKFLLRYEKYSIRTFVCVVFRHKNKVIKSSSLSNTIVQISCLKWNNF